MGAEKAYKSPTEMGVNRAGFGIIDDEACSEAARQEVIRRLFIARCEYLMGLVDSGSVQKGELLLDELNLEPEDRKVVVPARKAAETAEKENKGHDGIFCGASIELHDGTIITGKNSQLTHASSSLILNAIKTLAQIPDSIHLLTPEVIKSIGSLKQDILKRKYVSLDLEETMIALTISATTNPTAKAAMEKLKDLKGCDVHLTHIPTPGDEIGLKNLGVNLTSDPQFSTKSLFIS